MPQEPRSRPAPRKRSDPSFKSRLDTPRRVHAADELYRALSDLLALIAVDEVIPESVSYMKAARAALANWLSTAGPPAFACVGKSHVWRENTPGAICQCRRAKL